MRCDDEDLAPVRESRDFGGVIRHLPAVVSRPHTTDEVVTALAAARDSGRSLAARGRGHSTYGQAQAKNGVVLDMSGLADVRIHNDEYVVAQAGATWHDVVRVCLAKGKTPPVLPDYLDLSVGGTLSVGGIGGTTFQHGAQVDNVLSFDVVTGNGAVITCSADSRPELFNAVRAGLGQCAIITQATIRVGPAPNRVRRYSFHYVDAAAFVSGQRYLIEEQRCDYVDGQIKRQEDGNSCYVINAAVFYSASYRITDHALLGNLPLEYSRCEIVDISYWDFVDRMRPDIAELIQAGEWQRPHPWWTVIVPGSAVVDIVLHLLAELCPKDLGESSVILIYPFLRKNCSAPWLRLPDENMNFLFGLLRTASNSTACIRDIVAVNRQFYETVKSLGAFRYPIDSIPFSQQDWQDHFGDEWPALVAAKELFDPHRMLAPGYGMWQFPRS